MKYVIFSPTESLKLDFGIFNPSFAYFLPVDRFELRFKDLKDKIKIHEEIDTEKIVEHFCEKYHQGV